MLVNNGGNEEDSSDVLVIPTDQQQKLLPRANEREREKTHPPTIMSAAAPNAIDDSNTQLLMDNLEPQSIASQPEQDRMPQLSNEYQVCAKPLN